MQFKNPSNNYIEDVSSLCFLWCLLFGPIYFGWKGIWKHCFIHLGLALLSVGIAWFIYPFFAKGIVERWYLRNGWIRLR